MREVCQSPTVVEESPALLLREDIRNDFPILKIKIDGQSLTYLDNAATTQKPQSVLDSIVQYYTEANSNVGRSVHTLSMRASGMYEVCREKVRSFINAQHAGEIIFTKHTTESINLIAEGFGPKVVHAGDEVVITTMEHHSNLLPWRRLCERVGATLRVVPIDEHGCISLEGFKAQLSDRTKLVALAHVSNFLGNINPVKAVIAEAHRLGVPVVVDGAQAVAHHSVDVQDLDADFYCFSGHKMYGPMGVGVLYGKADLLEQIEPFLTGGGIAKRVTFSGDAIGYVPLPHRLESGTPNIADAVGLGAAIDYLEALGLNNVAQHDATLAYKAADALRAIDRVRVLGAPDAPSSGIVSFVVDGLHPYDVGNHLNTFGIAVRTGVQCAIPMADALGVVGIVRASFGVYNTSGDIDRMVDAVRTVEAGFWSKEHPNDRFLTV